MRMTLIFSAGQNELQGTALVSQGRTREEAQKNLLEVIEIHLEEISRMSTLDEYLEECGYDLTGSVAIPQSEMIGFEKLERVELIIPPLENSNPEAQSASIEMMSQQEKSGFATQALSASSEDAWNDL